MTDPHETIRWGHHALELEIGLGEHGTPRLVRIGTPGERGTDPRPGAPLPLVEVTTAGLGRHWSGRHLIDTALGSRLRHRSHRATRDGDWHVLTVELHEPETGLTAEAVYRSPDGLPVLRSEVALRNEGAATLHLESVGSLVAGCLTGGDPAAPDSADLLWAENDWLTECRWQHRPLRVSSPARNGRFHYLAGRNTHVVAGQGVWSSCGHLPMGGLTDRVSGRTWLWQIEHNGGGWRWECGVRDDTAYTALYGPNNADHGWRQPLEPGAEFRTVPVALALAADGGPDGAFAALTRYRRATRRPHPDHRRLPVVFNDYMNCLTRRGRPHHGQRAPRPDPPPGGSPNSPPRHGSWSTRPWPCTSPSAPTFPRRCPCGRSAFPAGRTRGSRWACEPRAERTSPLGAAPARSPRRARGCPICSAPTSAPTCSTRPPVRPSPSGTRTPPTSP
ncbi:hypothetical protein [Streptomyces sp. NPDC056682]|uniref:hypothetical protein n=1 Tax=Streptomyces sp. NPDC056682 TaxID=3345909 RepID=UPI003683F604